MNPLSITKYVQYCMGFGYLDKKRYADDMAHQRGMDRLIQANLDQQLKLMQDKALNPQQRLFAEENVQPRTPTLIQRFVQFMTAPLGQMATMVRNTAQTFVMLMGQTGRVLKNGLESMISQVLTLFFGHKKDRTEEKKNRDELEYGDGDVFNPFTVEASNGAGSGGGSR